MYVCVWGGKGKAGARGGGSQRTKREEGLAEMRRTAEGGPGGTRLAGSRSASDGADWPCLFVALTRICRAQGGGGLGVRV